MWSRFWVCPGRRGPPQGEAAASALGRQVSAAGDLWSRLALSAGIAGALLVGSRQVCRWRPSVCGTSGDHWDPGSGRRWPLPPSGRLQDVMLEVPCIKKYAGLVNPQCECGQCFPVSQLIYRENKECVVLVGDRFIINVSLMLENST